MNQQADDEAPDPFAHFQRWFAEARQSAGMQPDAVALATATPDGHPSVRMVLFKGVDERGFVFYTNYESRKASELESNPRAALAFYWPEIHRSIRIEGATSRVTEDESDAYFASRPVGSRLSAAASHQSEVIPDRESLEQRVAELANAYGENVPRPDFWGGYRVTPYTMEFWQGMPNRLHDRVRYRRSTGGAWLIDRLSP